MIGLDTNVLVRYLTQDDPSQAKRVDAIIVSAQTRREKLHVDSIVLCELVWVLRGAYDLDKETVSDALERILEAGLFSVDDRDLARDALAMYRVGKGDFADYLLGKRNRRAQCSQTVTFDRGLRGNALFSVL